MLRRLRKGRITNQDQPIGDKVQYFEGIEKKKKETNETNLSTRCTRNRARAVSLEICRYAALVRFLPSFLLAINFRNNNGENTFSEKSPFSFKRRSF